MIIDLQIFCHVVGQTDTRTEKHKAPLTVMEAILEDWPDSGLPDSGLSTRRIRGTRPGLRLFPPGSAGCIPVDYSTGVAHFSVSLI